MSIGRNGSGWNPQEEPGHDAELAAALELVDPASDDPGYWLRFRDWVMRGAAAELARRRLMAELTVGDVMASWARTVVPTAVLAAALAGLILLRGDAAPTFQSVSVEELLVEADGFTRPAALGVDEQGLPVIFAEETF